MFLTNEKKLNIREKLIILFFSIFMALVLVPNYVRADDAPVVTSVTIAPVTNANGIGNIILQGGEVSLSATVNGENNPAQDVTWSISGQQSDGTSIDANGRLTAAANEASTAIEVKATSVQDTTKSATVSIRAVSVDNIKITTTGAVRPGSNVSLSADLTGTNLDVDPADFWGTYQLKNVNWTLEGNTSTATSISSAGYLRVGADEQATSLTVKAASLADGTKADTVEISVRIITDENLYAAICEELGKNPNKYILTAADLKSFTTLDLSDKGITKLDGLWAATNVEKLDLSGNPLTKGLTSSEYSNILTGIGSLSKLKELDLSRCDLGVNYGNPGSWSLPSEVQGLGTLASLEKLDLSDNKIKGYYFSNGIFLKLKELDLSGNYMQGATLFSLDSNKVPFIEKIDLSNNYIHFDEVDSYFEGYLNVGLDKFVVNSARNLADLYAINVTNAGNTTYHYIGQGERTVNIGTVLGDYFSFSCLAYSAKDTVKVTVNGEKYTAGSVTSSGGVTIPVSGLEAGKSYTLKLEVMHMAGDTRTYTVKFKTKALPSGSQGEDSAGITDAGFQNAVCAKLGEDPKSYEVTKTDMEKLTGTFSVSGIANAGGLQYASNLTGLSLSGTFTVLPDLGNLTKLTSLQINGEALTSVPSLAKNTALKTLTLNFVRNLTSLPDLSGLTALTGLTISYADQLTALPDLRGLTALKTLSITNAGKLTSLPGLGSLASLTSLALDTVPSLTSLPDFGNLRALAGLSFTGIPNLALPTGLSACTELTSLQLTRCPGFDLSRINDASALTSISINQSADLIFPATLKLDALTSLGIASSSLTELPAAVKGLVNLKTLILTTNKLADLPDLSTLTSLESLTITNNSFTVIPASLGKLTGLKTLDMSYNAMLTSTSPDLDLSGLTQLSTVKLNNSALEEFPTALCGLSALTFLDLSYNNIRKIEGPTEKLTKLTTLNLLRNQLDEFPAAVKNISSLTSLRTGGNLYTDLPADLADYLPNLRTFDYGGYIKYTYDDAGIAVPQPGTNAAAVAAALKDRNPAVNASLLQGKNYYYYGGDLVSQLKKLDSSLGEIPDIRGNSTFAVQSYSLQAPEGTTAVTFTPTALLDDTTIMINGVSVANGNSIEVPVANGVNEIQIVCSNEYTPPGSSSGKTTTYNLTLYVGSSTGEDFVPVDGGVYSINMRIWHSTQDKYSMADQYFKHAARMEYRDGVFSVYVTTTKDSWISAMQYRNEDGEYVQAERVSQDKELDISIYRVYVKDFEEELFIKPYVVPMGSAPIARILFDSASILDITDSLTITTSAGEGGTISPNGDVSVAKGLDQTFTITANEGYTIADVLVDGASVGPVDSYTFEAVTENHTIAASFKATEEEPGTPIDFNDIAGHWGKDAIDFASSRNLFNGTTPTTFAPDGSMTRGMFVTVLGRMAQVDTAAYSGASFSDVKTSAYYGPYIKWAADNGIVSGLTPTTFGPDEMVTREQAATILARYLAKTTPAAVEDAETVQEESIAPAEETQPEAAEEESAANEPVVEEQEPAADAFVTEEQAPAVEGNTEETAETSDNGSPVEEAATVEDTDGIHLAIAEQEDALALITVTNETAVAEETPNNSIAAEITATDDTAALAAITFADAGKISAWAKDSVAFAQEQGIFKGDENNKFNPQAKITRAEAATVFARLLGFEG